MSFALIPQTQEFRGKIKDFYDFLMSEGLDPATARSFIEYHLSRKEVYQLYEQLVLKAINSKKFRKWGSKDALVFVKTFMRLQGKKCNIHNSYSAYYSRLFKFVHPQHARFLREKKIHGLKKTQIIFQEAA